MTCGDVGFFVRGMTDGFGIVTTRRTFGGDLVILVGGTLIAMTTAVMMARRGVEGLFFGVTAWFDWSIHRRWCFPLLF
jgi:hypothetical protein